VALIAVVTVGPGTKPEFLTDTIESIQHYASVPTRVLLVCNAADTLAPEVSARTDGVDLLQRDFPVGKRGKLYYKLAYGIQHTIERYECQAILLCDDDGLVTGRGGDVETIRFFEEHPNVAFAGSYKQTCTGSVRDFSPPAKRIRFETTVGLLRRPTAAMALRRAVAAARRNGYVLGEHIMGGICLCNPRAAEDMHRQGNLARQDLIGSGLQVDHILCLLARASGFELADFATGSYPAAAAWQGLPYSPQEIVDNNKSFVHSVRYWKDLDEVAIRGFFRERRTVAPT
jgi:hypothetical protein